MAAEERWPVRRRGQGRWSKALKIRLCRSFWNCSSSRKASPKKQRDHVRARYELAKNTPKQRGSCPSYPGRRRGGGGRGHRGDDPGRRSFEEVASEPVQRRLEGARRRSRIFSPSRWCRRSRTGFFDRDRAMTAKRRCRPSSAGMSSRSRIDEKAAPPSRSSAFAPRSPAIWDAAIPSESITLSARGCEDRTSCLDGCLCQRQKGSMPKAK